MSKQSFAIDAGHRFNKLEFCGWNIIYLVYFVFINLCCQHEINWPSGRKLMERTNALKESTTLRIFIGRKNSLGCFNDWSFGNVTIVINIILTEVSLVFLRGVTVH